jgi:ATP-dependent DNA helicase RecG
MKLLEDSPVPQEGKVLCENRGTGIPSMIDALRKAGMEPPQFMNSMTQFKVVCSNQALFDKETLSWLEQFSGVDLNDRQRFALACIYHKEKLNNFEYCRMNECDSRVAGKELGELVDNGLVIQHGTRRWAFYTLARERKKEFTISQKRGLRRDRRQEILAIIKGRGECGRREITGILPLSGAGISYWLRRLVQEGKIEPTTDSLKDPGVKYRVRLNKE